MHPPSFPLLVTTQPPTLVPADDDVRRLAAAIDEAKTVAIFAGAGVEGAHDEVIAFADLVKAPIGHSLRGKQWIQYDNPFDVGMTGLLGYGAAHAGIHDADLLVLIGTDFPYEQFLPDVHEGRHRPDRFGCHAPRPPRERLAPRAW